MTGTMRIVVTMSCIFKDCRRKRQGPVDGTDMGWDGTGWHGMPRKGGKVGILGGERAPRAYAARQRTLGVTKRPMRWDSRKTEHMAGVANGRQARDDCE